MDTLVVISREDARAQGLTRFFTGVPCIRGHVAQQRRVSRPQCPECERLFALNQTRAERSPGRPVGSKSRVPREYQKLVEGFTPDPERWSDDGGAKRVAIYDHNYNPPRLVRRVGWTNCLGDADKPHRILSYDVAKERICTSCKTRQSGTQLFQPRTSRGTGKGLAPVA